MGGVFQTRQKRLVEFRLPEFSHDKTISWVVHVDEHTDSTNALYDMIIGMDLIHELGLIIDFNKNSIIWEETEVPMKARGFLQDHNNINQLYEMAVEPSVLQEAEQRQTTILDADYSAVDIVQLISTYDHLNVEQRTLLCDLFFKHRTLFQGGLGTCNI